MKIGLFLPTSTNAQLVSTTTPQFEPTYDRLLDIVTKAERYGIDFGLSLVKYHGFGGPSRYWDASLDPFTCLAGLIARTSRIKLFATAPVLALHPALVARAAATIDSISPGRFGLNVVTGWLRAEYESMGLWPGADHFERRYKLAGEYVKILRELWATGRSDFKGEFYTMDDCRMEPLPCGGIDIVSAGQSDAGLEFAARYADYSFISTTGTNDPASVAGLEQRTARAEQAVGRKVGSYPLVILVAAETDGEAMDRWNHYCSGIDTEALAWAGRQASQDTRSAAAQDSTARMVMQSGDIAMGTGRFVGSYENVARMLDEMASYPHISGIMLGMGDWFTGVEDFGERIQPLMKSRATARAAA